MRTVEISVSYSKYLIFWFVMEEFIEININNIIFIIYIYSYRHNLYDDCMLNM